MSASVYRLYDESGSLQYVGSTRNGVGERVKQHTAEGRIKFTACAVETYETISEARAAETQAIRLERPAFNVIHADRYDHEPLKDVFRGGGSVLRCWGLALKSERQALSLTREQLAAMVGTTHQTIGRIEQGQLNPRDHVKAAIAVALGTQVETVFAWPSLSELVGIGSKTVAA